MFLTHPMSDVDYYFSVSTNKISPHPPRVAVLQEQVVQNLFYHLRGDKIRGFGDTSVTK
jgi:hypothetical protein